MASVTIGQNVTWGKKESKSIIVFLSTLTYYSRSDRTVNED